VAAHAGEILAVAGEAGRLIEPQFAGGMPVKKIVGVIGGFQVYAFEMTLFTTERIVDAIVANQAIRHLGQIGGGGGVGFIETAVAGGAGVIGVEMAADVAHFAEVFVVVDRRRDNWREVAHLEVKLVVEAKNAWGWFLFGQKAGIDCLCCITIVALEADGFAGEVVVGGFGARRGGDVATGAGDPGFVEVKLVGERGLRRG